MAYNYIEAMTEDIRDYINNEVDLADYEDREELEEKLYDTLFVEDSITGNASGSYTFNSYLAKEYVEDNLDLVREMADEFGERDIIGDKFMDEEWEWFDVSIRCYLLGRAISETLDDMESENELNFD